ncbi:MAG: hypothetical protein GX660_21550 [Clostridiaceae bacterium]|nr:hypothetical protein [Clostridiaceae bacterium]
MKCNKGENNDELEAAVRELLYQYMEKYKFCEEDNDFDFSQKLRTLLHRYIKIKRL